MTRRERLLAQSLAFVAGVHSIAGLLVVFTSGRWVANCEQAGLMLTLLVWSLLMAAFAFVAVLTLIERRRPR